jgi:hypothetical protein
MGDKRMTANMKAWRKEMKEDLPRKGGKTFRMQGANPRGHESSAGPSGECLSETGRGTQKQQMGRNRAAERCHKPKDGSRRKLAASGIEKTRHAEVARHKGNVVGKNGTRDNVVRGTSKGRTLGRRQRAQHRSDDW